MTVYNTKVTKILNPQPSHYLEPSPYRIALLTSSDMFEVVFLLSLIHRGL